MRLIRLSFAAAVVAVCFAVSAHAQSGPLQFYALTPCRVVDTRNPNGTNGGPALSSAAPRDFQIRGNCGVPVTAKAVSMNLTVTGASAGSWVTVWPSGQAQPFVSNINFDATTTALANGVIIGLSSNTNDLSAANANGTVHVILDITGYFQ